MNDTKDSVHVDLGAYVDCVSAMMGLPVPEASKPIVIANLEVAQRMANILNGFDLDEREEPAPVYRP